MNKNRWMMNRAGLLNFWYYDEEEFKFSDGKLLLRGANGSGKSVTMQSLIPLLLDGNKSPERLDPFSSRARKLEDYLLGETEHGKEESTGYIYIEFKKENSNNYLTIGMGLNAKRGRGLNSWGFLINDGRRIGKDFFLYKNVGNKISLSKLELKNRIGEGGEVKEGQKEYMSMVNKYLFGFDSIEDYDELIKLLIKLRTPKLSKEFKPTVIYEIMNDSLQPLSDDDLRPMSEAIENMDNIENVLKEFKESKKAADVLKNAYDQYNRYILWEKTKEYLKSQDSLKKLAKEEKELEEKSKHYENTIKEQDKRHEDLELKKKIFEEKKQELEKHDLYKIRQMIQDLSQVIELNEEELTVKGDLLSRKKDREIEINKGLKELQDNEYMQSISIKEQLQDMDITADEFAFDEQGFMRDELLKDINKAYDFSYIKRELKAYSEKIVNARKALEEEKAVNLDYDNNLRDLDKFKKYRDNKKRAFEESQQLFLETKEEFIENVYTWAGQNKELKPSQAALIEVGRKINGYGKDSNYDSIIREIRREYNRFEEMINTSKHKLAVEKENQMEVYKEKKKELESWINKKDPEPEREKRVIESRQKLERENIPFIPFFMAVDFQDDLDEGEKGNIEEALMDMGILDALIIPRKYRDQVLKVDKDMSDKYLFASPKFLMHELSYKLKADRLNTPGINTDDIDNVLKSILIDEQEEETTFINRNGFYGIGPIRGKTSSVYDYKYIGSAARKKFRQETIEKLEQDLYEIKRKIDAVEADISEFEKRAITLENEYSSFPDKQDLETSLNQVKEYQYEYDKSLKDVASTEERVDVLYNKLKETKQKVHTLTSNIAISRNLEAFIKAEEALYDYKDELAAIENKHLKLIQYIETKDIIQVEKDEVLLDIDNTSYELKKLEKTIKESLEKKTSLMESLKISGFEEIEKEIINCIENLKIIPKDIEEAIRLGEQAKANYSQSRQNMEVLKEKVSFQKELDSILSEGFIEEYLLGFVFTEELDEKPYVTAKKTSDELKYMDKENKTKDDYMRNLQEKFHENRQSLIEYSLKMDYILDKILVHEEEVLREAILSQKRMKIEGKIRGKYVDFFNLIDHIQEGIEENEKVLRESDRQLFEDILAKDISKKIRAKIYHSEEWVKKINKLMEAMDTSSGLSFSLSWKSKGAESEGQLDTKELIGLLRKDGGLLTESELDKLSTHFKSKISEARRYIEEESKMKTFQMIMKEVLDYRKWFEFTLYFRKTNENRKELTNNAFYKFSGGEKAMAMYVPLFSAVYSKYEGARKDCPRIISLDEAFAGVDEINIRDMFRLLNELELNFIINSQILWGDYDTVPSLSICELFRPNNANFVSVLRYKWDGKMRSLITNGDVLHD